MKKIGRIAKTKGERKRKKRRKAEFDGAPRDRNDDHSKNRHHRYRTYRRMNDMIAYSESLPIKI